MDNRREIPPKTKRSFAMAAPVDEVLALRARVYRLAAASPNDGDKLFHEAVKRSGLSRNVGYLLLRGQGSVKSLRRMTRTIEEEERARPRPPAATTPPDLEPDLAEWLALGARLKAAAPLAFVEYVQAMRELVDARERERAAMFKLFRGNPEP